MARTPKQVPIPPKPPTNAPVASDKGRELNSQFTKSQKGMEAFRNRWEEFLDIAYARLSNTAGYRSRVREGTLSNLLWERSARVVAQLPTGRVQALSKNDIGKSKIMDLVWHKYVMLGANTDYSFFTKLRLWDYYSMVYGASPAFYDYRVDDEYTGPDWTVLDPRYVFPQVGRLSLQRCQYVFVEAYHNKEYLKGKLGQSGWNDTNINKILTDYIDDKQPDVNKRTTNLQTERGSNGDLHRGEIQLVTKYERGKTGKWTTFAPQFDNAIVREIDNPHKSGRIPIVFKYCFPLLDSIWGMGDVERGESLQKAVDTYVNLSMDFAKFKLYPPMWYTDEVTPSQLRYEPAAKWKLPHGAESAGFMQISGNYTNEMNQGYQFLKGALMNQNGTTDTTIGSVDGGGDMQQGKTPQAIEKNTARENSRDNWDRSMLEEAHSDLANGMINLIGTKQPANIEFYVYDDDIKAIYDAGGKDVLEIFDSAKKHFVNQDGQLVWDLNGKGAAKVNITPQDTKGSYKYILDPGTTMAADDQKEYERLQGIAEFLGTPTGQMMLQKAEAEGREFKAADFLKRMFVNSGVQDWEEILPERDPNQQGQQPQQFDPSMLQDPNAQQMMQQGTPQGPPQDPQAPQMPQPQMPQMASPNPGVMQ